MKTAGEKIKELVHEFVSKNWDKIDISKCEIEKSKESFLLEINRNLQTAIWVITEVADWGMDKKYLKDLYIEVSEECEFTILKINDKYIKLTLDDLFNYHVEFVEPKKKTITYFD